MLINDDAQYYVQPDIGDEVLLKFDVPKMEEDMSRSTFLHSKGHYEILRNPTGTPDICYLETFRRPGRFIEFSKEHFLELSKKIGKNDG